MSAIHLWRITPSQNIEIELDASSLDGVTRQLPDGYYSTFRTFDGCSRVLGLTAHLERLYGPVSAPEVNTSFLRRQLGALLEPYRLAEARVRAIMTQQGQVYLAIEAMKALPREVYERGVRVETAQLQREHPHLKSTTFIGRSDSERKHIAREGIFEALLIKDGEILEGMTSNFFYVVRRDGIPPYLSTARHDILLGVTRQTIIDIAQRLGLEVDHTPLKLDQIRDVDEAFISSSSRGIVPVVQIDRETIGQGKPGPITKQLSEAYRAYVMEKAETI